MGGITDKVTGRVKKAIGDLTDDPKTHREGVKKERKGEAKDEAREAERRAERRRAEAADLERRS